MQHASRRIQRSSSDRIVAGVAAGIGDYFGVDPTIVRLAFVALTFAGGFGIVAYGVLWMLIPSSPELGPEAVESRPVVKRADLAAVVVIGILLLGVLFLFRAVSIWPGDGLVWPVLLAASGIILMWNRSSPERQASVVREIRERETLLRIGGGIVLLAAGVATFLALSESVAAVGKGLVAALIVAAGLGLIFLPWWRSLVRELADERRERIRSQERAELAAHLHDSVLQTLTLIQRRSSDPESVVQLARRQEHELRSWLNGRATTKGGQTFAASLRAACEEIEDLHGVPIEAVFVGDCPLDDRLEATVAAAREAMANAARLSGDHQVAVYLEVGDERARVFVRDRGIGFDPDAIPPDRKGLSESIVGRMHRYGGTATIHTAVGEGTELELEMPRPAAGVAPVGERSTS
jgi:signal transduction histidine kinase/phage shock protein PspC (stress-responsive transcriptional regulator)